MNKTDDGNSGESEERILDRDRILLPFLYAMYSSTIESQKSTGIIERVNHALYPLRELLLKWASLLRIGIPERVNNVQYLLVVEPVLEREFTTGGRRIIIYTGDEEGEVRIDFNEYPRASYVIMCDIAAGQDIMIINAAQMARTVSVPVGQEFDVNELEFSGPDFMKSVISAFVDGRVRYTYPGNYEP